MPLLRAIAEEISANHMVAGVIEEIITEEALYALLPFTQVNGKAYVYNRETKLADSNFMAQNSEITDKASEFKSVTTHLKILIGDVDVDKFIDTTMSDIVSQNAIQLAMKAKGMGRRFKDALVNGGTARKSPNSGDDISANEQSFEFDGIRKIWMDGLSSTSHAWPTADAHLPNGHPDKTAPSFSGWKAFWMSQIVTMFPGNAKDAPDTEIVATSLTCEKLDELVDAIPYQGVDLLMMRKDTYRAYKSILRASGGITPDQIMIKNFGMVPAHDGVPIIINDYIPTLVGSDGAEKNPQAATFTEVYALRLNEVDGLHGLFGGSNAGIVVEDIGTVQNKDANRTRLKWYCGLALKSTKSMAVLRGVAA